MLNNFKISYNTYIFSLVKIIWLTISYREVFVAYLILEYNR